MTSLLVSLLLAARVATPTFSLPTGTYTGTQTVTVSSKAKGEQTYCTTDGSVPRRNSTIRYTAPYTVASTTTLRCRSFTLDGRTSSLIASATYTISTPIISGLSCDTNPWSGTAYPTRTGTTFYYCDCSGAGADPSCVPGSDAVADGQNTSPATARVNGSKNRWKTLLAGQTVALCRGGSFPVTTWDSSNTNNANCQASNTCDLRDYMPPTAPTAWATDPTKRPIINGDRVFYTGTTHGVRLVNLEIRAPTSYQGPVMVMGSSDGDICNVRFYDCYLGVFLGEGPRWAIRNSQFELIGRLSPGFGGSHAIFNGCTDCIVDSNYFAPDSYGKNGYYDHNIYLSGWRNLRMRITNNEIHACPSPQRSTQIPGTIAIVAHGSYEDLLIENNLIQCDNPSLYTGSSWGIGYGLGGYIYGNPYAENIYMNRTLIRRNRIIGFAGLGINVNQSPDSVIENNVIDMPVNTVSDAKGIYVGNESARAAPAVDGINTRIAIRNNTIIWRGGGGALANAIQMQTGSTDPEGIGYSVANNAIWILGGNVRCFNYGTMSAAAFALISNNACNGTWNTTYDSGATRVVFATDPFVSSASANYTPLATPLANTGTSLSTCSVGGTPTSPPWTQPCYAPKAPASIPWISTDAGKNRDAQPDIGAMER